MTSSRKREAQRKDTRRKVAHVKRRVNKTKLTRVMSWILEWEEDIEDLLHGVRRFRLQRICNGLELHHGLACLKLTCLPHTTTP